MNMPVSSSLVILASLGAASPAFAEWQVDSGVAIVAPLTSNSTMELLAIACGDPYQVEVYSRGGPVRPEGAPAEADYFYKPGKVEARIDGAVFRLAAAGSEAAVVLFAQGSASDNYLAPVDGIFIEALKDGSTLTLAFDATPDANAQDGSAHETVARFSLAGARAALEDVLASCR